MRIKFSVYCILAEDNIASDALDIWKSNECSQWRKKMTARYIEVCHVDSMEICKEYVIVRILDDEHAMRDQHLHDPRRALG